MSQDEIFTRIRVYALCCIQWKHLQISISRQNKSEIILLLFFLKNCDGNADDINTALFTSSIMYVEQSREVEPGVSEQEAVNGRINTLFLGNIDVTMGGKISIYIFFFFRIVSVRQPDRNKCATLSKIRDLPSPD